MGQTHILIVEDEQLVALGLQACLEALGYAVAARVATGEAAIEKAGALRPDLVLMDIKLAGKLDGIEAAEQIRAQFDLPVIYLTAYADEATLQRARVSEPFGFMLKPFEERELHSNIEMALYKHELEGALRDSERKFRGIFAYSSDGIILIDHTGAIIEWNESAEHITGLTREEVLTRPLWDVLFQLAPPEGRTAAAYERTKGLYVRFLREGSAPWVGQLHEAEVQRPDGMRRAVQSRTFTIGAEEGQMAGAVIRDVTERQLVEAAERDQRQLAEALRDTAVALNSTLKSEEVFERILDNIGRVVPSDAATLMLLEGEEVWFASHRGYAERGLTDYLHRARRKPAEFPALRAMFEPRQPCLVPDVRTDARWVASPETDWVRSHLGVPICIKGQAVGVLNLDSETLNYFTHAHAERLKAFADQAAIAIENARLFEQAHVLSITDMLTGLHNRRHFFSLAEAELARGRRYGHQVVAIMMDLDHFKEVNDTYGHIIGDSVLRQVAGRLRGQLRAIDILARYGGEEFVALLPETSLEQAVVVAGRLRESVAHNPIPEGTTQVAVTVSLGIALWDAHAVELDELLKRADDALYQAKAQGRNRVALYPPDSRPAMALGPGPETEAK